MASAKRPGDTPVVPPMPNDSNSVGVAFVYAENKGYIFYYNQSDSNLYVAAGLENAGYTEKAITVGGNYIPFNIAPTPTPLAAGFNNESKEIRVYYVQAGGQIGELKTGNFGNTWSYGGLNTQPQQYQIANPGGLTAYPGEIWRVIIRMKDQEQTLVELYEQSPGSWNQYIIP